MNLEKSVKKEFLYFIENNLLNKLKIKMKINS